VQGIATIQQFVQRCFLNLENGIGSQSGQIEDPEVSFEGVSPASFDASRWNWMKNYRVWEANRRVFLYPENYIEPELRSDKSEFFRELEESLSQSEVSTENVEKAFHDYLAKLDSVARLKIVAHAQDPYSGVTHVFGRTDELPGIHYHRTCTQGVWSGWLKMPIEIPSEHLAPVFYNRRLYLYWLEFAEKADQPKQDTLEAGNGSHKASRPAMGSFVGLDGAPIRKMVGQEDLGAGERFHRQSKAWLQSDPGEFVQPSIRLSTHGHRARMGIR
jgi:hypothetical protein